MSPVLSVSSFLALVEATKNAEIKSGNKADFIFRGQDIDEPLRPRIARFDPNGRLRKREMLMLTEFERLSLPLTEFAAKDSWDWMALAQHHGLPTRLLDWSYSALAALWFCVQKPPHGDNGDGVVWILKTSVDDFIKFPTVETPYTQGKTRIFRPRSVARRILAQSGLFTCHKRTSAGIFVPLESNKGYKDRLVKITVPVNSFATIRKQLVACGVSNATLFPDLDGLAAHLRFLYFP